MPLERSKKSEGFYLNNINVQSIIILIFLWKQIKKENKSSAVHYGKGPSDGGKWQNLHQVHNIKVTDKSLKNFMFLLLVMIESKLHHEEIRTRLSLESLIFLLLLSHYTN